MGASIPIEFDSNIDIPMNDNTFRISEFSKFEHPTATIPPGAGSYLYILDQPGSSSNLVQQLPHDRQANLSSQ